MSGVDGGSCHVINLVGTFLEDYVDCVMTKLSVQEEVDERVEHAGRFGEHCGECSNPGGDRWI